MYIEKDDCDCNSTNSSESTSTKESSTSENLKRWSWLIDGWKDMDFKQKLALFLPSFHYVNARNNYKRDFDEYFEKQVVDYAYTSCRAFLKLNFDPDGQGIPNIIMEFAPIDPSSIPDSVIRAEVERFGILVGLYKYNCNC